jgi:2-polyprenyl-3-methyl-5-hydroxy-6-metoxy-1,4-benzoquinol methylase
VEHSENKKLTHTAACPVCGSKNLAPYLKTKDYFLTGEEFDLVQCNECSFVFTSPVPEPDHIFSYYDSPEYVSHEIKKSSFFDRFYALARKRNIRFKYKVVTQFKTPGKLLDVGCGTGELLKYFKDNNWYSIGIEPVEKARSFAKDTYSLDVFDEKQLHLFDTQYFDVITLWHVLEHVYDLNRRIEELKRILKPDGVLIIAVPNINSYDAAYYGQYWGALDVPRHLYHFSQKTMSLLLENHRFKVVKTYPMKMDAYYVSLLSERYKQTKFPYFKAFVNGYTSNRKAGSSGNYSSMIFVIQHI